MPRKGCDGKVKLSEQEKLFVAAALEGVSWAEAARRAGYKSPRVAGSHKARSLREVIEEERARLADRVKMKADEVLEVLTVLARDSTHKDQFNALKTLCTIHGLVDRAPVGAKDVVDIKIDDELARFQKAIETQTAQKVAAATNCNGAIPAN